MGFVDWIIVAVYLTGTMIAGVAMRRYIGKVEHFLVAGREMDASLGVASMAATEFGIITAMYTAELGHRNGFAGATPGILLAMIILAVGLTGFVIKPLRASGALTVPELLESRFGPRVRWLAGVVMVIGGLLNMGVFLRIGGDFLMIVMGIPPQYLEMTMTALLIMVLVYTALGGLLSVLVTTYMQFIVFGAGLVVVSVLVALDVGWERVVRTVESQHGAGAFNPFLNSEMGFAWVVWQALTMLSVVLTWQTFVQRVLSARNPKTAQQIYTRTSFYFVGRFLIPAYWGMAALAVLGTGTDAPNSIHAMPVYLSGLLPVGVLGLVVAAMLAAEMSTDSSYMLGWGSIIYNDVIRPMRKRPFSERSGILVNRLILVGIGIFLLLYGLWYRIPGSAWDYLSITANVYLSAITVLLIACCYWKKANATGAVAGILGGVIGPIAFLVTGLGRHAELAGLASYALAAGGMVFGSWAGNRSRAKEVR